MITQPNSARWITRILAVAALATFTGACDRSPSGTGDVQPDAALGVIEPESGDKFELFTCQPLGPDVAQPPPFEPPIVAPDGTRYDLPPDEPEEPGPCPPGEVPVPEPLYGPKGPPVVLPPRTGQVPVSGQDAHTAVQLEGRRQRGLMAPPGQFSPYYYAVMHQPGPVSGAGFITQIEKPEVNDNGHSLNEVAIIRGPLDGAFDSVEIGWRVAPVHHSTPNAHLFVFHWSGGKPTCYNGCGWVQTSATVYPGLPLPAGKKKALRWLSFDGNWWAIYGKQYVGYFPADGWASPFTEGEEVQWFGEVAELALPWNEMGSGSKWPSPTASWMSAPCVIGVNAPASCVVTVPPPPFTAYYPYSMETAPPATPDMYHYGGPNQ